MNAKKMLGRILFLTGAMGVLFFMGGMPVFGASEAAGITGDFAQGMSYLGAALATGIAAIGGGIAVGAGAPAAIGALTEDSSTFGKALIFVAMGEGIALYGLLVAILILNG